MSVLYAKIVQKLQERAVDGRLGFPDAKLVFSWIFHLDRREAWALMRELEQAGYIEIVPYRFIRIKRDIGKHGKP